MIVVGIDPGKTGALAGVDDTGALTWVADMPLVDGEVSAVLLAQLFVEHMPFDHVVVEQVAAFPKNGSVGNFKLGMAYGIVLALACRWTAHTTVRPTVWKKAMGLTAEKERSRARALELWPQSCDLFARKKDDGRAEAALLAKWGIERGLR